MTGQSKVCLHNQAEGQVAGLQTTSSKWSRTSRNPDCSQCGEGGAVWFHLDLVHHQNSCILVLRGGWGLRSSLNPKPPSSLAQQRDPHWRECM